jgi:hypothetical protein
VKKLKAKNPEYKKAKALIGIPTLPSSYSKGILRCRELHEREREVEEAISA